MVTRVNKFLGGLGADVTSVANVHATENRISFGAAINPAANVHVTGNVFATTTIHAHGGFVVPNDGDIGSLGAADAIQISSGGVVTFKDDIKIKDGGTIGTATDVDAVTIAAAGAVTFSQRDVHSSGITIADGGEIGSASDTDAIAISAAGVVSFSAATEASAVGTAALITAGGLSVAKDMWIGDDIVMDSDGAIIKMGDSQEISITHVADTGILLEDSGGSPTLQLHDAGEAVSSDGSKLILTSNSVAFNMPTADGNANEVLKTDGSGTLSFTAISSNAITSGDTVVNTIDPNITFVTNGAEEARITATGNLVLGSTTATHLLDIRGTANTGVLTASGITFPSSDGSANQAVVTDGSGALSFATVLTSSDPATTLAATPDLGSVAGGSSQDAFGQNLGGLTETDLLSDPSASLSTLDTGALS